MKRLWIVVMLFMVILVTVMACGGGGGSDNHDPSVDLPEVSPKAVVLNDQLTRPWGMAFLPDRRILVNEKGGAW